MSETHKLKTLPEYWDAIEKGFKNFEVRKDDRDFRVGDFLRLDKVGSTDYIEAEITYILPGGQFGIDPEYVVMGIRVIWVCR